MGCRTCGTTSRAGRTIAGIIERNAGAQTEALLGGMGAAKAKPPFKKRKSSAKSSSKKSTKSTSSKKETETKS